MNNKKSFVEIMHCYDVARSLARRLGGDVVLDTTYTDGARFVFSLPTE